MESFGRVQEYGLKTILITGGCGFIGTNLVGYLSTRGYKVRILDNLSTSSRIWIADGRQSATNSQPSQLIQRTQVPLDPEPLTIDLIIGDILDTEAVERAVQGMDSVIHLAAHTSVVESLENPKEDWDINVKGTLNLLEACRRYGVYKFVFASSSAAVGEQTPPIDELKIPKPLSPYGASKLAVEALCSSCYHSFGLRAISLRFGNCYGPYSQHKPNVIPTFVKRAKEGKPLIVYGDGNQTRDFIHVDDICQAIYLSLMALDHRLPTLDSYGEVFQIASGVGTSINELAQMMKEVAESNLQIIHEPEREGEIKRNYSDISKARAILGFEPKIKLKEGLKKLWNSKLSNE